MKELVIELSGQKHTYHLPTSIREMTGDQIIEALKYRSDKIAGIGFSRYLSSICGIDPKIAKKLPAYHKYTIEQCFEFLLEDWNDEFTEQRFDKITIEKNVLHGYIGNFGNTTWEEFIWADQLFINKDYKRLIAVLYREKRKNYDGETDIRIPFTNYGIAKRLPFVNKLDETTITALAFQYRAMRKASLENKYPQIFPEAVKYENDEPEPEQEPEANNFSWVKVHRNILGDNIQHEKDYLQLNVHTVLNRLNEAIIESQKKKTA